MHFRSCEILLEKNLARIPRVTSVYVKYKKGTGVIRYEDTPPSKADIERVVSGSGYRLGVGVKKPFFSRHIGDYTEALIAGLCVWALYTILRSLGLFDLSLAAGSAPSLVTVFPIGLVAGVSTCMALVGGLVLGISARHAELHPEATPMQKFRPHLYFNLGRLASYALLGGVIGLLGSVLKLSSGTLGILVAVLGIVMLVLGLKLTELFPRLSSASLMTLPPSLARMLGLSRETKEYSHTGAFMTGALTFFVPCGFTQAMQLFAISTGSFFLGGSIMFLFALGTMPGLLGIGGLTSALQGTVARYFFKFAGVVVISLALFNISNGLTLAGYPIPSFGGTGKLSAMQSINLDIENGVQTIRMEQNGRGYVPNRLTVKRGIPVKWVINSTNPYTCASFLVVPQLGISKVLQAGENIIEFTPVSAGELQFSCSMGMYRGSITVIN